MRGTAGGRMVATVLLAVALSAAPAACGGSDVERPAAQPAAAAVAAPAPASAVRTEHRRDLSIDEAQGGHTLARHVGKTDADLTARLQRESRISAASTYTDRVTAERIVGAAIDAGGGQLDAWQRRSGRRPNLVLHRADPAGAIGRSMFRGARESVSCDRAVVVLRWNVATDRFFVLTSYPDCRR